MSKYLLKSTVAYIALLSASNLAIAQETNQNVLQDEEAQTEEEVIQVIGSRLRGGDATARVEFLSAEEIRRKGLATVEDIIRTIPQNFSSVNGTTNVGADEARGAFDSALGSLGSFGVGTSTANLRGLGSANTLVLVNGKRIAGDAGSADSFANVRDIPAAAIERVEILLDGGSAIYGSDAVGGVINIVMKKNFSGGQISGTYEDGRNGGNQYRVSGNYGHSWNTGSASITGSFTSREAIRSADAGFITQDYRSRFSGNPLYNFEAIEVDGFFGPTVTGTGPRGALICNPLTSFFGCGPFDTPNAILPVGNDGTSFDFNDLQPLTVDDFNGFIEPYIGGEQEDFSVTANFRQSLADFVDVRADFLFTRSETETAVTQLASPENILVPASNAFNTTGQDVFLSYNPIREIQSGLFPSINQQALNKQFRYNFGADFELSQKVAFIVDYSYSRATGRNTQYNFGPTVPDIILEVMPGLASQTERLNELLASSDPDEAVNLFGDGSNQNATIAEFLIPISYSGQKSINKELTGYFDGEFFEMPGGTVSFVVGAEHRTEAREDESALAGSFVAALGTDRPTRKLNAVFGEVSIPIYGESNAVSGIQELQLSLQLRGDSYTIKGASGLDDMNDPIIETAKFSATSPRIGLSWVPADGLRLRAAYAEGFRAPTVEDLFGTFRLDFANSFIFDPLLDTFVPGRLLIGQNADLKPETSKNWSVGLDFRPPGIQGFALSIDYSKINFIDRITSSGELSSLLPADVYGNLDEFFIRDENGVLLENRITSVNISRTVSETIDVDMSRVFDTDWGLFNPGINLHYVVNHFDQAVENADIVDRAGKSVGVDRYRLQGRLNWSKDNITASIFANYTPSYENNNFETTGGARANLAVPKVDDYFTVDVSAGYNFENGFGLKAGARNLFNAKFPFALGSGGVPYDASRVDLRGRVLYMEGSFDF